MSEFSARRICQNESKRSSKSLQHSISRLPLPLLFLPILRMEAASRKESTADIGYASRAGMGHSFRFNQDPMNPRLLVIHTEERSQTPTGTGRAPNATCALYEIGFAVVLTHKSALSCRMY